MRGFDGEEGAEGGDAVEGGACSAAGTTQAAASGLPGLPGAEKARHSSIWQRFRVYCWDSYQESKQYRTINRA